MEDFERITDEGPQLVKDAMDPAVHLKEDTKVGDARRTLEEQNASFGVVSDVEGKPLVIVTWDELSTAHASELVQEFKRNLPHPETVDPYETLDKIVQTRAEEFANDPNLMGIVVQEQGDVRGVLSREKIEEHIQIMAASKSSTFDASDFTEEAFNLEEYVGFPEDRLTGTPVRELEKSSGVVMPILLPGEVPYYCRDCPRDQTCSDGPEVIGVADYDSSDPPFCKRQHRRMYKM